MDTSNLHDDRTGDNNNPKERLFDFSQYRDCGGIHYSEFCDSDELQHIVPKLIEVASTIPVDDPRNKVLAAYLLTPSALTSMMPILFCYGESGTGKSSIGSIAQTAVQMGLFATWHEFFESVGVLGYAASKQRA